MTSTGHLQGIIRDRGERYAVTATIRPGEHTHAYVLTAEQAETAREQYESLRYYSIRVYAPTDATPLAEELAQLGAARTRARDAEREATEKLRAAVLRAGERSMAEADIARRAGVDRMTVRTWMGKR